MNEQLPFLPEHSPIESQKESSNYEPEQSDEELKTAALVDKLFVKAKNKKSNYDGNWPRYYKMFRGDQWKKKRPSYLHSEVLNFIFQAIQSQVPIMTDARPQPTFTPRDPTDLELAEVLSDCLEADWQHGKWSFKLSEVLYDGKFYGNGFSYIYHDPTADNGLGRIRLKSKDPFTIYPDTEATAINEDDCDYFFEAEVRSIEKVKAEYAGHQYVDFIKSDLADIMSENKLSAVKPVLKHNYNLDMPKGENYNGEIPGSDDKVLVLKCFMRPRDTEEIEEESTDELTNEVKKEYITKKKYPQGRYIVKINKFIFEDKPLPLADLKFPYQMYTNYIDPREFWGISEIEPLESPQMIFNKLVSFALDVMTLMGNPVWLIPSSSGVQPGSFHNAPGLQIPFDGEKPPTRAEGVQLQPYVIQMINLMENWFNSISGSTDVTRGVTPGSVTAASAIENLQDSAKTRIREQMRHMDSYLVDMGEQYQLLVFEHYTVPRVFRLTNKAGVDKYFRFHVEQVNDEFGQPAFQENGNPIKKAMIQKYFEGDDGKLIPEKEVKEIVIKANFDLKVNTGSGLPFSKAEKEQRLLQFFNSGIIDEEEVLKQSDYPNYEAVLERIRAKQAQMAQMQQQPK